MQRITIKKNLMAELDTSEDSSENDFKYPTLKFDSLLPLESSDDDEWDDIDSIKEEESDPLSISSPTKSDFFNTINNYSDSEFKSNFWLERQTVKYLIKRYDEASQLTRDNKIKTLKKLEPEEEVYIFIWYITNTNTFVELGNLFGIGKKSALWSVRKVCHWLISIGHEFVKWPKGQSFVEISKKFENMKQIPGIIGAIHCTNIVIQAPVTNKEHYYDKNFDYSIVLQGVCDCDKKFIDLFIGAPGNLNNDLVLKRSDLFYRAKKNVDQLFNLNYFLIGDASYRSLNWLIPPYKNISSSLTTPQNNFNSIHSSTRMTIENAFSQLKTRFRRLMNFNEERNLCMVTNICMSCCILHNICITLNDQIDEDITVCENITNTIPYFSREKENDRRKLLFKYLVDMNII